MLLDVMFMFLIEYVILFREVKVYKVFKVNNII